MEIEKTLNIDGNRKNTPSSRRAFGRDLPNS